MDTDADCHIPSDRSLQSLGALMCGGSVPVIFILDAVTNSSPLPEHLKGHTASWAVKRSEMSSGALKVISKVLNSTLKQTVGVKMVKQEGCDDAA